MTGVLLEPGADWQTLHIPLATFRATFRGREVPGAPALVPVLASGRGDELVSEEMVGALKELLDICEAIDGLPRHLSVHLGGVVISRDPIANFTPLAERTSPEGVVGILDAVFSAFDRLVNERGLEKIKTIGDAYMVAGGLPSPRADHCEAVVALAHEMQAALTELCRVLGFRIENLRDPRDQLRQAQTGQHARDHA